MSVPTPLEFLTTVYTDNELPLSTRMRAAMAAAPYVHAKLEAHALLTDGDLGDRLDRAAKRLGGLEAARASGRLLDIVRGPKVIEGEVLKEAPKAPAPMRRL